MNKQWLAMEHHRLHLIEEWPESARREAALAACRSAMAALAASVPPLAADEVCSVCGPRTQPVPVVEIRFRGEIRAQLAA